MARQDDDGSVLWRVILSFACFGIIVADDGVVRVAAPIARWAIGKKLSAVQAFYLRRGAKIEMVG